MADNQNGHLGAALDMFTRKHADGADSRRQGEPPAEETCHGDVAKVKASVIRPVFAAIGNMLQERGHEFNISEEQGGKISIHIVPAGVSRSIHPYDWFPTLSLFAAPFTKTVGLHGRNMRPNSEAASGPRGEYKLSQVDSALVERELTKFISEIANW
jgi:hypothetical protein